MPLRTLKYRVSCTLGDDFGCPKTRKQDVKEAYTYIETHLINV